MIVDITFVQQSTVLDVDFSTEQEFRACFEAGQELEVDFGTVTQIGDADLDPYTGDYQITPQLESQTLETAQKYMVKDMEVNEIPIYSVSNNSGGTTVVIGG